MTIQESIRAQWEAVRNRSVKEKLSYFWEYYGIKSVCILTAAVLLIAFIVNMVTQKEYGYTGVFFGATAQSAADGYLHDFAQAIGMDTGAYDLTVQSALDIRMDDTITDETYQAMQSFAAMVAAKMVENIAADVDLFLYYSYLGYTVDLRTVFTGEQLTQLEPHLHYIDGELLRQQENSDEGLTFDYGDCPDSRNPDAMTDPIPVGIDLVAATQAFHDSYSFASDKAVIGICTSSERNSVALAFLQYAFGLPLTIPAPMHEYAS